MPPNQDSRCALTSPHANDPHATTTRIWFNNRSNLNQTIILYSFRLHAHQLPPQTICACAIRRCPHPQSRGDLQHRDGFHVQTHPKQNQLVEKQSSFSGECAPTLRLRDGQEHIDHICLCKIRQHYSQEIQLESRERKKRGWGLFCLVRLFPECIVLQNHHRLRYILLLL